MQRALVLGFRPRTQPKRAVNLRIPIQLVPALQKLIKMAPKIPVVLELKIEDHPMLWASRELHL